MLIKMLARAILFSLIVFLQVLPAPKKAKLNGVDFLLVTFAGACAIVGFAHEREH